MAWTLTVRSAITANTRDMQGELQLVWDKLLPAFGQGELKENKIEHEKLKQAISKLKASR